MILQRGGVQLSIRAQGSDVGLHGLQLQPRVLLWGLSTGCASFRPHLLLPHGLLHDCKWRSALCCANGLLGGGLLHFGSLLVCREPLLHSMMTTSCPLSALTFVSAVLLISTVFHFSLPVAVVKHCFSF